MITDALAQDYAGNSVTSGPFSDGTQSFRDSSQFDASIANAVIGGNQGFRDSTVLNASAANAINGGTQNFYDNSILVASVANAISGGSQFFDNASILNITAANAISGGGQNFSGNIVLNLTISGAIGGGGQYFHDTSSLNITAANAIINGYEEFHDNTTLNASVANAVSGGTQQFHDLSSLIAATADAVSGGGQGFRDASSLIATSADAVSGGGQSFRDISSLNASAAFAVSGGSQTFYDTGMLNASATNAVSGGIQVFNDSGVLQATAGNAISGGTQTFFLTSALNASTDFAIGGGLQTFNDSSALNASAANAVSGGVQTFNNSSTLNATAADAVSGGTQIFNGNGILNATAVGAISGGIQNFGANGTLNASAANSVSGGTQIFNGNGTLNATAEDSVSGGIQDFHGNGMLNASAASALSGGVQTFDDNSVLNASVASAIGGGSQIFNNTATLNISAANAIGGGTQEFRANSVLDAVVIDAVSGGSQTFYDASILSATVANAVSGGTQTFNNNSILNASAVNATSGGLQSFFDTSTLNASAAGAAGGSESFYGSSTLNATLSNAVSSGTQNFHDNSTLNSFDINAVNGGSQSFSDNSTLNALVGNAVDGGSQSFFVTSTLNASAANAVSGGSQNFHDNSLLNASVADAISGGVRYFYDNSILNASAAGAVSGGQIELFQNGSVQIGVVNALTSNAAIDFNSGGALILNGNSTVIGQISGSGLILNMGSADATLTVDSSLRGDSIFGGSIEDGASGALDLVKTGSGQLILNGLSTYSGTTVVTGGTLAINGSLGNGDVTVGPGGTLSGVGTIGGAVQVDGTLAVGNTLGTLTTGPLTLNSGSTSIFVLNSPGVVGGNNPVTGNDLVRVTGDLTLSGTLDARVASAGFYRLLSYQGSLSGAFDVQNVTSTVTRFVVDSATVQTSIPGQINLSVLGAGQALQFWDGGDMAGNGIIDGGTGMWSAASTNWTGQPGQANINGPWGGSVGVFSGAAGGPVAVSGTQAFDTLQFSVDNYVLSGGVLAIAPATGTVGTLSVDNNIVATISSPITGALARLAKTGAGTLILQGANTYTGGTSISGGTLQISSDANLGTSTSELRFNGGGGTLATTASFDSTRIITLVSAGAFDVADGTVLGLIGTITGAGGLSKLGDGLVVLTGTNTYAGGTTITAGTLQLGAGATLGSVIGDVVNDGLLSFDRSDAVSFSGVISGTGAVSQIGIGTTTLTGTNTYTGGTTITTGTLQLGDGGALGSITGDVANDGLLSFDRSDTVSFSGAISGTGAVNQAGGGTTTLTGANTYTGGTTISAGTLQLGDGGTLGSITGDVTVDGILAFNRSDTVTFGGAISGLGAVSQIGRGTTIFTAINTYTGGTSIAAGTLQISSDANLGDPSGGLTFTGGGGTLATTANFSSGRNFALGANGAIDVAGTTALGLDGVLSGPGSLTKLDDGLLTLTSTNTYTGGTVVGGGTLQLGVGGTSGSIAGDVVDSGVLAFNRSDMVRFGGIISGTGAVKQIGMDTLVLTAANTYTGGTTIADGALQLGDGGTTGSIMGNVANSGILIFYRSDDVVFSDVVSGIGAVNQAGPGTTTFTGHNTYTGATNVDAGTLLVNGAQPNATGPVTVAGGATLGGVGVVGGTVTVAAGGTIAPGDGLNPGTLTTGSLTLVSGSLLDYQLGQVSMGGGPLNDLIAVRGDLTLGGTLNATLSPGGTYGSGLYRIISYSGTLTDNGLTLGSMPAGSQNYVQTSIAGQVNLVNSAGLTLNVWDGAAIGAPDNDVVDGGTGVWQASAGNTNWTDVNGVANIPFRDDGFAIFAGTAGTVTVDDSRGAITVAGMQFAADRYVVTGDAITLSTGTDDIRVGDGTAAGTGYTAIIGSALIGSGELNKTDLGTLILTGVDTYTGNTTITDGTLQLGNGGTTGSITGNVTDNGVLVFNRSDNIIFSGTISGAGIVNQSGSGASALTGANSYTGGTTISAGTLVGSAGGFGTGAILDNAALIIDQHSDASFANAINGTGAFTKQGTGSLELTGVSALSGVTTVMAGRLAVNGSLAGSLVTVQNGATLGGSGTVGGVIAQTGSMIGPGNSIGTLTVAGNYDQASGSIYQLELASTGQSDRINTSGAATIANGALLAVTKTDTAGYVPGTRYIVLTAAGGVNGVFTLTGNTVLTAFTGLVAEYDAHDVYLDVAKTSSFASAGITPNQIATGGGADSLSESNPLSVAIANLPTRAAARAAFDQLSGELHSSNKTETIEDSRFVREAAIGRLRSIFDIGGNNLSEVWGQGFGSWGSTDGDGNAAKIGRSISGFFVGADLPMLATWRMGVLGGYSRTTFDVKVANSSGTSDNYDLGLYGGTQWGKLGLRVGAAYTWHDIVTNRSVNFVGFSDNLSSSYNAETAQVFGDLGYRLDAFLTPIGNIALEPFVNLAYVNLSTGNFSEQGGNAALSGKGDTTGITFSTFGLRGSTSFDIGGMTVVTPAALGWRHAYGELTPTSTFGFSGGSAFTIEGVPIARDSLAVDAGLETNIYDHVDFGISYSGQIADHAQDHGIRANVRWMF